MTAEQLAHLRRLARQIHQLTKDVTLDSTDEEPLPESEEDQTWQFIVDACIPHRDARSRIDHHFYVRVADLYGRYVDWSEERGVPAPRALDDLANI